MLCEVNCPQGTNFQMPGKNKSDLYKWIPWLFVTVLCMYLFSYTLWENLHTKNIILILQYRQRHHCDSHTLIYIVYIHLLITITQIPNFNKFDLKMILVMSAICLIYKHVIWWTFWIKMAAIFVNFEVKNLHFQP